MRRGVSLFFRRAVAIVAAALSLAAFRSSVMAAPVDCFYVQDRWVVTDDCPSGMGFAYRLKVVREQWCCDVLVQLTGVTVAGPQCFYSWQDPTAYPHNFPPASTSACYITADYQCPTVCLEDEPGLSESPQPEAALDSCAELEDMPVGTAADSLPGPSCSLDLAPYVEM
jgi:hypothetical protein